MQDPIRYANNCACQVIQVIGSVLSLPRIHPFLAPHLFASLMWCQFISLRIQCDYIFRIDKGCCDEFERDWGTDKQRTSLCFQGKKKTAQCNVCCDGKQEMLLIIVSEWVCVVGWEEEEDREAWPFETPRQPGPYCQQLCGSSATTWSLYTPHLFMFQSIWISDLNWSTILTDKYYQYHAWSKYQHYCKSRWRKMMQL